MSIAGEFGGFLGRMAGVMSDPLWLVGIAGAAASGYRRFWAGLIAAPVAVVAAICAINWDWWGPALDRAGIATNLLLAHGSWAAVVFALALIARRIVSRRPSSEAGGGGRLR